MNGNIERGDVVGEIDLQDIITVLDPFPFRDVLEDLGEEVILIGRLAYDTFFGYI